MRALVIYCHPQPDSFTAAVRDTVLARLDAARVEVRLINLYAERFDPVLTPEEHARYETVPDNTAAVAAHVEALRWCDTLIFVYPTWWYGLPALLKGWLDRVLLPGVAFLMPDTDNGDIRPGLTHIRRLGVFTTCGASWWLTRLIGAPGRRTLLRGVRLLCARRCRTTFAAHYSMDSASRAALQKHLEKVARKVDRLTGGARAREETTVS
jgi:NAD(P)H dehydrogenase (quinone)